MAATYEPIASTTLGSNTGVVSFDSIPGTYTDLLCVIRGLGTGTTVNGVRIRVNDISTSTYSTTVLAGNGTSASSNREADSSSWFTTWNGIFDSDDGGIVRLHLQNYANTNVFKTALSETATNNIVGRGVHLWRSTNAITKVSFALGGTFPDINFASGTDFALYGIKAA